MGTRRFLTSTQAAAYLGVSRPTLYKLIDAGDLTAYQILTHYRFTREDLDAFLDRARLPSKHGARATGKRARRTPGSPPRRRTARGKSASTRRRKS